jgi:DNA-binding MarR family transcriptional regulator
MTESAVTDEVREAVAAFLRVATLVETISGELWQSHQLTLTQARLLRVIQQGAQPAGQLATRLGLSAASLTRVLERLEERALLERQVDRTDRRRVTVSITQQGRETVGGLQYWMGSPITAAIQKMTEEDRTQFTAMLDRFLSDVQGYRGGTH